MNEYASFEKINLAKESGLNEKWVQDRIAENPSILGLGDLILKDKERIQPKAGRFVSMSVILLSAKFILTTRKGDKPGYKSLKQILQLWFGRNFNTLHRSIFQISLVH